MTREFSFYEIPILHIQITPIRRTTRGNPTINQIRQKSLTVPRGQPADDQWDLVYLSRGLSGTTPADPKLLIDQLQDYQSYDSNYWGKWNTSNPKQAAILWPIIQKLSVRELYVLIPSILEVARADLSPAELKTEIDALLIKEYKSLVEDMRQAGRSELANSLLSEAIADYPNDENLKALSDKP